MEQYISKTVVVLEIERRVNDLYPNNGQGMVVTKILKEHYKDLKDFIDTLEVKEVDLKKEYEKYYEQERYIQTFKLAKHFFELGMSVRNKPQKGE